MDASNPTMAQVWSPGERRSACLLAGVLVTGAVALGCGGFMDDLHHDGPEALVRIGRVAGAPLPTGVTHGKAIETTGIDWLMQGEVRGPESALRPWFDALVVGCDGATVEGVDLQEDPSAILGQGTWLHPSGRTWRTKSCQGRTFSGPHIDVSITTDGDPAWVWVHAMTM